MNFFALSAALQIINALLVIAWIGLAITALVNLRSRKLPATPKAIWAFIILGIPILGAIAFFIVKPEEYQA
jgi:hypothetical protein